MNKKEFLDTLGRRLAQQLSQEKIAEHIRYYDAYLTEKVQQGMTEQEAVAQLGDPLLIARTIMDTSGDDMGEKTVYEEGYIGKYQKNSQEENLREHHRGIDGRLQTRLGCLVAVIVIILILTLILKLVGSVLSFILPVLIPVLVIGLILEYFRKK